MLKIYRKELANQLSSRFALDTTPSKHILLALKMNPSVDTSAAEGSQFVGKVANWEMMQAEYRRALRRQAVHRRRPHMQPPQQQPCNASAQHVATPAQQMAPPQNDSRPQSLAQQPPTRIQQTPIHRRASVAGVDGRRGLLGRRRGYGDCQ